MQAFSEANRSRRRYSIRTVATRPSVESAQGVRFEGLEPLPEARARDLVVVPGVPYRGTLRIERSVIRWLRDAAARGARIASVCTGAFALGEAGLLDGRRCTTHWSRIDELRRRFPAAHVVADRLFVTDGPVMTSAGIASGIDLALALIEREHGPLVAAEVAREMVVYMRRDGGHGQQSVYLDYRTHMHPGIHRVQDQLTQHPDRRQTLDDLAALAGMSRRSLTRTFRQMTGVSVHQFTTRLRLEVAEALLHDPTLTVDAVAKRAGFESGRQLRRLRQKARSN
ncbi:MAG TPA: DJ-1/PfpI family protein [Thermoanaerobaculia bacterium]|nr:DJ-1/PfpI family protein [Thermoanaerobaculia bacterium]